MAHAQYIFNQNEDEPLKIWNNIKKGLSQNVEIKSIKDQIPYTIDYITDSEISFSAKSRNKGRPEIITKEDFLKIVSGLRLMEVFNTSTSKAVFKESKIYKKRSPMFALLISSGVIVKC